MDHRLRPALPSDRAFICTRIRAELRGSVGRGADEEHMVREVDALFDAWAAEGARLLVACDTEDEGVLLGFACAAPPVLHAVYVRSTFRGLGLARAMLEALGYCSRYTLPPSRGTRLTRRMVYAPRLVLRAA